MLKGLSLFSGIGGLDLALQNWVKPSAYCEIDPYAQTVLLSKMRENKLTRAPIVKDIKLIKGGNYEIVYGGFPCQDISVAGLGKGLAGERSGLFFEIMRIVDDIRPKFIFLENVPGIVTRGLDVVTSQITQRGYDCRWTHVSAREIGALHKRERWFCLAYINVQRCNDNESTPSRKDDKIGRKECPESFGNGRNINERQELPKIQASNNRSERIQGDRKKQIQRLEDFSWCENVRRIEDLQNRSNIPEPLVCRKNYGVPFRMDRIKCLGNSVVPLQAKIAFMKLMGI